MKSGSTVKPGDTVYWYSTTHRRVCEGTAVPVGDCLVGVTKDFPLVVGSRDNGAVLFASERDAVKVYIEEMESCAAEYREMADSYAAKAAQARSSLTEGEDGVDLDTALRLPRRNIVRRNGKLKVKYAPTSASPPPPRGDWQTSKLVSSMKVLYTADGGVICGGVGTATLPLRHGGWIAALDPEGRLVWGPEYGEAGKRKVEAELFHAGRPYMTRKKS